MPEKAPTYRIDENLLREKLSGYRVEIDPAKCSAIEEDIAHIRFQKTLQLPRVNLRLVVPAILFVGLITLLIVNFDSITGLFTSEPETIPAPPTTSVPDEHPAAANATPVETTNTESLSAQPALTATAGIQVPAAIQKTPTVKPETLAAEKRTDTVPAESAAKKPSPVMAQPPNDSAAKTSEMNAGDTAVQDNAQPEKRKKRRRKRNSNMDELKESTLQPSSADDEVIVPQ